ncbi:hypothetical protein LTR17_006522 [Elasticomyces elasticus]|nr:hypothetical protein LTR17_006522 [Elasticomyces elasticus]
MAPALDDGSGDGWQVVKTKSKRPRAEPKSAASITNSSPPQQSTAVVIGSTTKNGKSQKAKIEARLNTQREAALESAKQARLFKSRSVHWNRHLAQNSAEVPIIQRDRLAFGIPLTIHIAHEENVVFTAVRALLDEYNSKSIHSELDPLDLTALSDAATPVHGGKSATTLLLIGRVHTLVKLQAKLVGDEVFVRMGDSGMLFRTWLETLPDHRMPGIKSMALEKQYKQWTRSKKPFRFTDLPTELQNRILLYAVGEYVESHVTSRGDMKLTASGGHTAPPSTRRYVNPLPHQPPPVNLGLLKLNKATRANALGVLQYETAKRYTSYHGLYELDKKMTPLYHTFLRHVELAMSHLEYFDIFQCQIKPFQYYWFQPSNYCIRQDEAWATVLSKLPNLQRLEIFFMSTVETSYSPWVSFEFQDGTSRDEAFPEIDFCRLPCQKVVVDWIMTFAAKHILACKKLKTVRLTGYVKDETKYEWEGLLNEKNGEISHVDEIEARKEGIMALPDSAFPPSCLCPHPCGNAHLDAHREGYKTTRGAMAARRERSHFNELVDGYVFDFDDTFEAGPEMVSDEVWASKEYTMRRRGGLSLPSHWGDIRTGP